MTLPSRWDYVVVGAGSAGAVVAARLSENASARVLLLEAGPDYRSSSSPTAVTGAWDYADLVSGHPELWWTQLVARRTVVQEPREYGRGRGVGGSSSVNGLLAVRGAPEDYDEWAESCDGWSYEDVLPALRRLEDEQDFPDEPYHGRGGPIPIQRAQEERWGVLDRALREAAIADGYPWAENYNAPDATGVSPFAFTARDGRRISTNDGYLEPARDRPNLTVVGDQLVDTILFDQSGTRARGVRASDGTEHLVGAAGEVIVCAGAVHSPALLMRSGVGPAEHLKEHGIDVVADLPVGVALQEHPLLTITFPVVADSPVEAHAPTICVRYASGLAGGGPNDMMILTGGGYKAQRLADGGGNQLLGGLRLWVMQSVSNGTLELASRDPNTDPRVDLGLLSDERDLVRLEDGMQRIVRLLAQEPLASLVAGEPDLPSREDLLMVVGDGYSGHVSATCRMGRAGGSRTVVTPDCRVVGLDALRIVDASIMPQVPRANTHLSVVMLAEHAVERLRQERGT